MLPVRTEAQSSAGESWKLGVLPDIQDYSDRDPGTQKKMVDFLLRQGVSAVAQVGDVTNHSRGHEWQNAVDALSRLQAEGVAFLAVPGNHDYENTQVAKGDRRTEFGAHFGEKWLRRSSFSETGWFGDGGSGNAFGIRTHSGRKTLLLGLEPLPRERVVAWAESVLRRHPHDLAILVTHMFLDHHGTLCSPASLGRHEHLPGGMGANDSASLHFGESLQTRLVDAHPSLQVVLSGHYRGAARAVRNRQPALPAHYLMANYQHRPGEGHVRIMTFCDGSEKTRVETFSAKTNKPLYDRHNRFAIRLSARSGRGRQ
jgi:hypothetical protein